ncbi:3-oxoacyl-ACP reductase FabG [Peterkaempfera bronchialis]|uniref:3-oxoacyl-ACP reductase FabG n=1 Tax=Peterkaempfera bronchialis TaxID=2126346 RepID=A0A345T6T3_9ACTN|nr:3-oxoacyl-ACP reductase FabG [Peterkaempfera bronchialis]AXI81688.1 3-oxoacyl-ACP reductase FabG [Peterkaempfera bronchialis]
MGLLKGRAAVVTGAAQGIGRETARVFAQQGAHVVVSDVDTARAAETVAEITAEGGSAVAVRCDVTSEEEVRAVVARCVAEFGSLDVMVNNAGITRDATLRTMTLEDYQLVMDVHLRGAWLGTREAAAVMRGQGGGSIVNLSSLSAKVGNTGQTNYAAAKAGIVGLSKSAAKELGHRGVRVNAVQPGLIRTPMTAAMRQDIFEAREKDIPLQRAGDPREVANVILFLASDLSSYITGGVLEVTGGRLM